MTSSAERLMNPIPPLDFKRDTHLLANLTFARSKTNPNIVFILTQHADYCILFNVQTNTQNIK